MTKAPFPKKSERQTELLEIIRTDVCGPMRVESIGKSKYFITFIDDHSRWCVVRMLKRKNETFEVFKHFKATVENQTGRRIRYLQSDNGKEYVNSKFDAFLRKNEIKRRLTVTLTPEQNGVAERKNQTLVEMARCLMIQSGLPLSFWGEAINTANYIRNRCPTSSLNGKTPYKKWTGNVPDVGYFQKFGCLVYSLDREPNKGKFQSRSRKGIFMGYTERSKAYRIWIPDKHENVEDQDDTGNDQFIEDQYDDRIVDLQITAKRKRGRPRQVMTGLRGRPKKMYQVADNSIEEVELAYLTEVPVNQFLKGPDAEEWLHAMEVEMKSVRESNGLRRNFTGNR
ncbi:retrovirus-related pol polyprotein from transposon tnt 1-94 [Lasius niger]|uniref:Retrovirus-related pol polyprotein from transposon tnt 1-94 n=1 Tax=Lasius niger TaxID=67767 RepID=A0A0J7KBJ3_LASNI|nr:retrovirus-related pol polyprotein from transposon tnt 1-94 [Lasius niger]